MDEPKNNTCREHSSTHDFTPHTLGMKTSAESSDMTGSDLLASAMRAAASPHCAPACSFTGCVSPALPTGT